MPMMPSPCQENANTAQSTGIFLIPGNSGALQTLSNNGQNCRHGKARQSRDRPYRRNTRKTRMRNKLAPVLLLVLLLPAALLGQSKKMRYSIGERPTPGADSRNGTAFSVGNIRINDTQVPAYGSEVADPFQDEDASERFEPQPGAQFSTAASPEQLQRLAAYFTDKQWVLVPRGWRLQQGRIGVNGSSYWVFIAPDGNGWLSYSSDIACVGCAQSAASPFFAEARRDAQENDMDFYSGTDVPIHSVRLRPDIVAYRADKNGRRFDGLVHYRNDGDTEYWKVEVTLPPHQQDLARPILNRFVPKRTRTP
ncbi:hypothetical protein CO608_06685 [Lysobacteraceae bacterium NML08-0793]|nr:hypothetical protein CO608_06685 [Xanthomonadaceae bacterium NML08-0793]